MGALTDFIQSKLVPEMVQKGILTVPGASTSSIHIDSVDADELVSSGFMLSTPYKVKVKLSANDEQRIEYQLVVKKPLLTIDPDAYRDCQFDALFQNEITAYTEIIPAIGEAEKHPRYFYSEFKQGKEALIVLEDFTTNGWRMAESVYDLDEQHIMAAVTTLGRFHGECYALKETRPDVFNGLVSKLKEARYGVDMPEFWFEMLKIGPKRAVRAVQESELKGRIPEVFLNELVEICSEPAELGKKSVLPVEPLAVICHGDYLRNNIAFKYSQDQTKVSECMMFDLQTFRYASPGVDLATFFMVSTQYEVRNSCFEKAFRLYVDIIIQILKSKLGEKSVPPHYNYESFLKDYTRHLIYGFQIGASFLPVLYEPDNTFKNDYLESGEMDSEIGIQAVLHRGGKRLDAELRHMVLELYELHEKFQLKLECPDKP